MNIIIVSRKHGHARSITLGKGSLLAFALLFVSLLALASTFAYRFWGGTLLGEDPSLASLDSKVLEAWDKRLLNQRKEIEKIKLDSSDQIDALTLRLGEMQARLMRLDALGQRLTQVAHLDEGEFNFDEPPALGGPLENSSGESLQVPDLQSSLSAIQAQIDHRAQQLDLLNELFTNRMVSDERFVAGRPVNRGWLSSHFGYRTDPFTGRRAWHAGIDFAGKTGSDIVSVAAGIVTSVEERNGYGLLVEINHGGNLVTRYAHCKKAKVKVGDIVKKGQVIAEMGSTGRSTGPHVHFEVLKDGQQQNPLAYINRASRG